MKHVFLILTFGVLSCMGSGCRREPVAYTQGDVRITPPVREETDSQGLSQRVSYNDGGTQMLTLVDATGRSFHLFVDRRIGKKTGFCLNAYPDAPGSVRITDEEKFKKTVLTTINYQ